MKKSLIYVSSACSSHDKIGDAVQELVDYGFYNIELTGGTQFYDNYENDLLGLKEKYRLNYLVHNYFPPSKNAFVFNLASSDGEISKRTFKQLKKAIQLSKKLGATRFGFHAGFFVDLRVADLGGALGLKEVNNKALSIKRFCERFSRFKHEAGDIELYLENNVYPHSTAKIYRNKPPFMLLDFEDFQYLKTKIDFKLLVDIGHLKVTVNTLNLNRQEEFSKMINSSDYIHISDNDGLHDQNNAIEKESELYNLLKEHNLQNKVLTLEIYDNIDKLAQSYKLILSLVESQ